MQFNFSFRAKKADRAKQQDERTYDELKEETGFTIVSKRQADGSILVAARCVAAPPIEMHFPVLRSDEAHTLYISACELVESRAAAQDSFEELYAYIGRLFASYNRA